MRVLLVVKSKKMKVLGVMYLSAVIKQCGHECRIVDIHNKYLNLSKYQPDVIGYSVMTGDEQLFQDLNSNLKEKARRGDLPLFTSVFGGPHPTFFPDNLEADTDIDYVVKGEAENWFAEFLGSNRRYDKLDDLPWPDRSDFPDMKIRDFITTRGCPQGTCTYCFNERWNKMFPELKKVRTRSVDDVISEIDIVSPEFVYFQDSCFGVNLRWLREFSAKYKKRINIPFHCHLTPSQVTEDRVELLAEAGCKSVRIALEAESQELRETLNRGKITPQATMKAAKMLKLWNIELMVQNILGLPGSTIHDDLKTLDVNIKCQPAYGWCSIFQPYPGTKLADVCIEKGWYKGDFTEIQDNFFDKSVLEFDSGHKEQIECLQKVFALCVEHQYIPEIGELKREGLPGLVHKVMRGVGDGRLYGGVI
jgi:radical SAM superfamily enzyme YgiQ (UPF0313 family)